MIFITFFLCRKVYILERILRSLTCIFILLLSNYGWLFIKVFQSWIRFILKQVFIFLFNSCTLLLLLLIIYLFGIVILWLSIASISSFDLIFSVFCWISAISIRVSSLIVFRILLIGKICIKLFNWAIVVRHVFISCISRPLLC